MTFALPAPGPWGIAAWSVAALAVIAALAARRPPSPRWLLGAALPALLGQIGTWRAAPGPTFPYEEPTAAAAALAAAVAPEAHGYLAGSVVALLLGGVARARATDARRPGFGAPAAVLGATLIGALAGAPSLGLLVATALALALVLLASGSRAPAAAWAALVGVGLAWLGARHFLLFELHHPLAGGRLDGLVDVIARRTDALDSLTAAGPGWAIAAVAAAWGALRSAREPRALGGSVAPSLGIAALVVLGAANTGALAPLHAAVAGGYLPRGLPGLPDIRRTLPAEGRCLAWPSEKGWRLAHRWSADRCAPGGTVVVAAPAEANAAEVFGAPWLEPGLRLEVLAEPPVRASSGPLTALSWRAAPVRWAEGPLPSVFSSETPMAGQLEAWLDEQLRGSTGDDVHRAGVWILDRPQGDMILLAAGGGITAKTDDQRRSIVNRLLKTGDRPRLVLVLGERWTVQRAIDLCVDARASLGPHLPCVWISER